MTTSKRLAGKAYAFFDSRASYQELQEALPAMREEARVPSDIELKLAPGETLAEDEGLREIVPQARVNIAYPSSDSRSFDEKSAECDSFRDKEFNYGLRAVYSAHENHEAADQLADILNVVYQRTSQPDKPFRAVVLFEHDGEYLAHE